MEFALEGTTFRVTTTPRGVSHLSIVAPGESNRSAGHDEPAGQSASHSLQSQIRRQLQEYLAGQRRHFDVALDLSACSPFQRKVLEACAGIPYGETTTYAGLAGRLGCAGAARAVGSALARNPVLLLIPCHRVLRGDGGLGGFLAGLEWKRRLLRLEGVSL